MFIYKYPLEYYNLLLKNNYQKNIYYTLYVFKIIIIYIIIKIIINKSDIFGDLTVGYWFQNGLFQELIQLAIFRTKITLSLAIIDKKCLLD